MNARELLWRQDTQALAELLAEHFKVKRPRMEFTGRSKTRGTYFPKRQAIRVASWTETWVVLHEFAHHLDDSINRGPTTVMMSFTDVAIEDALPQRAPLSKFLLQPTASD